MATALRQPLADPVEQEVDAYFAAHERKSLLRFITCGSVDDGKSTLIGRLLHDSRVLYDDQKAALERGGGVDFASLVDGLAAEREQGITIDVAYRYFATAKRKFIVADTPGHEQYTRNMATGASTAELAVLLVDARKGVLTQTRRHSQIVKLLGIRRIVLAVNKMDLVGYDRSVFEAIAADYRAFAAAAGIGEFTAIPMSGLAGDNVVTRSANMAWYRGPALLEHLETVPLGGETVDAGFRLPVQWVNRANQDFRGYAGTVATGGIRVGDAVRVEPSGQTSKIARIVTYDGDLAGASAGQAVTLVLADEVDCSRGDLIVAAETGVEVRDRFGAGLVWMASEPMVPGRAYWLKIGTALVPASVSRVRSVRDVDAMRDGAGQPLKLNDIGRVDIVLERPVPALAYVDSRALGGFILIDRASHATVAAGMIEHFPEARDTTDRGERGEGGRVVWLVGSSPRERRAFARRAQERLRARGRPTFILDACALREGLSRDLGETPADEAENRRRTAEVAKLLSRAGVTVLVAAEAPEGAVTGTEVDVRSADNSWDWTI